MSTSIDWEHLARQFGLLRPHGETCNSDIASRVIEQLLGEDRLRAAVDYYVSSQPGSELARTVLWQLHPWSAMQRCYEIYHSNADADTRCAATTLLRVVADRRALPWVQEFLNDPHPGIQFCGAGTIDQLLWSGLVQPEDCADLLRQMDHHPNEQVRKSAERIHSFLRKRENRAESNAGER